MAFNAQSGGAHSQPSLPSLPAHQQSDTHITSHLASRFHVSLPTAQLSSHALISLNTYTSSSKGPDGGKEGSAMGGAETLAERAWTRLGARSENQAVVFLYVKMRGFHKMFCPIMVTNFPPGASLAQERLLYDHTYFPLYLLNHQHLSRPSSRLLHIYLILLPRQRLPRLLQPPKPVYSSSCNTRRRLQQTRLS